MLTPPYTATITPDSMAIVEAIKTAFNSMSERVGRTEQDFVLHAQKVETRLDQLVDLARSVAVIQTQASAQSEQMAELRGQMRQMQEKIDTSINRLHVRIDEINTANQTRNELAEREIVLRLEAQEKDCETKINKMAEAHDRLSNKFHWYLSKGLTLWTVFTVLVSGAGWVAKTSFEAIAKEREEIVTNIRNLRDNANVNDVRMTQVINKLQEHLDEHQGKKRQ